MFSYRYYGIALSRTPFLGTGERLGHDWVHASFVAQLSQRRKTYPASLRRTLPDLLALRHKADYRATQVSQREAQQAVRRAQALVQTITAHVQGRGGSV